MDPSRIVEQPCAETIDGLPAADSDSCVNLSEDRAKLGARVSSLTGSVVMLGAGEATGWISSFLLFAYVSRRYGVALLGALALAQTVAAYVTMATDQGLRLIGARIVAKDPSLAREIVKPLMGKRLLLCAATVIMGSAYALRGPVPSMARPYVLGFVIAVMPYALTLDWLAWGLNQLGWMGAWKGLVKLTFVGGAILGMHSLGTSLMPLIVSNFLAAGAGATLVWILWRKAWRPRLVQATEFAVTDASKQLMWGSVFSLGTATMLNLLFNSADTLILAGMTSASEVGRYNAAYKLMFVVFSSYYLLTQSLYPRLSRMKGGPQARKLVTYALFALGALGACVGLVIAIWAPPILRIIYGGDLNAIHLLRILSLAIPSEFCVALLGTVLVSRGFHGLVLTCTASAASFNILLNFFLIPRLKADGAAWATVSSYLLLLTLVLTAFIVKPILDEERLIGGPQIVFL
jgi:O-antigen/teichoic acid export membrane protein